MRNIFWGIILIILGMLFLLDNMDVVDFGYVVRTYWPALLILWGISILMKKKEREVTAAFSDVSKSTESELFHKSSVFGNIVVNVTSQNFKGGSVSTVAGDCEIDLTKAMIVDGEHWLRLSGVVGSSKIILSKDIAISISAHTVFGDVQVRNEKQSGFSPHVRYVSPTYNTAAQKLKIDVTQVFGDIQIE